MSRWLLGLLLVLVAGALTVWAIGRSARVSWHPGGIPHLVANADGVVLCATGLDGLVVASIRSDGEVAWHRELRGALACGELAAGLLLVRQHGEGAAQTTVLNVERGESIGRVDLGPRAGRLAFTVGRWRIDQAEDVRSWIGPREERSRIREFVGGLTAAPGRIEEIDLSDNWVAIIEHDHDGRWAHQVTSGVIVAHEGGSGGLATTYVSDRLRWVALPSMSDASVTVDDRVVGRVTNGRLAYSDSVAGALFGPLNWRSVGVGVSDNGMPFAARGSNERAWVFIAEDGGTRAFLIDFEAGAVVGEAAGDWRMSTSLGRAPRTPTTADAQAPLVVDDGARRLTCLDWEGRTRSAELVLSKPGGEHGKVRWLEQIGNFAGVQLDRELILVDASRCEVRARHEGFMSLGAMSSNGVWFTTRDGLWRVDFDRPSAKDLVISLPTSSAPQ